MATTFTTIPVIDIRPLIEKCDNPILISDQDVQEVAKMLHLACRDTGFFYVKGHGVPDSLLKEARDVTRKFFDLSYEEKLKIKLSSETGFRGYQRVGVNVTLGKLDMHEAIDYYKEVEPGMYGELGTTLVGRNLWPHDPSNFKQLMEEYVTILKDLSRKIMRGIALALGGSAETFEGDKAGDTFWVMRLIGYPVLTDLKKHNFATDVGCGAHTDYGLLTLVNQDDQVAALQVQNRAGEWISAVPIPGTFVCNIGDMLKVWSNGEYDSTLHRVFNRSPTYRVSVAFFYEPNFDAVVEPLDFCKEKAGGVSKCNKVVYGEHLVRKVLKNFIM